MEKEHTREWSENNFTHRKLGRAPAKILACLRVSIPPLKMWLWFDRAIDPFQSGPYYA